MTGVTPDHHDADLVLRVYELRREPTMRASRSAIQAEFWPKSAEDVLAIARWGHPLNAAFRQVSSFWEMVYGFVKHGVVYPSLFLESNVEGLFLFAKIEPFLADYRREISPRGFLNAEWVARDCPFGVELFAVTKARVAKLAAAR